MLKEPTYLRKRLDDLMKFENTDFTHILLSLVAAYKLISRTDGNCYDEESYHTLYGKGLFNQVIE